MATEVQTASSSAGVEAIPLDAGLQNLIRSFIQTEEDNGHHDKHQHSDIEDDFEHVVAHTKDEHSTATAASNCSDDVANPAALVEAVAELAAAATATPVTTNEPTTTSATSSDTEKTSSSSSDVTESQPAAAEQSSDEEKDETSEDTKGDEAALASITKVNDSIDKKLYELERVTQRLAQHIVRLIALSWRARAAATASTSTSLPSVVETVSTNSRQAKSMSNRMEYEAGVAGEWLFNQLMLLDNIRGSSKVRTARKSSVAKIKSAISTADAIRARAKRAALAFHSIIDRQVARLPATVSAPTPNATPTTAATTAKPAEAPKVDSKRSSTKEVAEVSSSVEEKKEPKAAAQPAAAATKSKTVVTRDESLRWSPKFVSRELLDGVMIASMLGEGIKASSLTINVDENKHLLHISGVRPIKQRVIDHEATARAQAIADAKQQQYYEQQQQYEDEEEEAYGGWFGMPVRQQRRYHHQRPRRVIVEPITKVIEKEAWFDEKLQLPVWLSTDSSLYRTSFDESSGRLSISIPKVQHKQQSIPVTPKPSFSSPYHHPRRQPAPPSPFYDTQEYDDEDDENDDEEYEQSHPYHAPSYYAPPQYHRRAAPPSSYGYGYRPSPFGFGW